MRQGQGSVPEALLTIKVQPRASRNEVLGWQDNVLRVRVTVPPEGGRANEAVLELLAERLGIAKSRLSIARGLRSRDKLVRVQGLDEAGIRRQLGC